MALAKNDKTYILLRTFINDRLEKPQLDELFALLTKLDEEELSTAIRSILDEESSSDDQDFISERVEVLHENILNQIDPDEPSITPRKRFRGNIMIGIAALLAVVLTIAYYLQQGGDQYPSANEDVASRIMPGTNKATVTVNGQDFELDADQGKLMAGGDGLYYGDGQLLTATGEKQSIHVKTPLGGQYQLLLADGSAVWLNAGSELVYDTGFGKENRMVYLKGEAYFEVTKNADLPFFVETTAQKIEVKGTTFNVSAYPEEPMVKTTLQTGSVLVTNDVEQRFLEPNQQSILDKAANKMATRDVNAAAVIAWKDGIFDFHGMSVEECMRIIARWYQLEIVYKEKIPSVLLGGKMSRGVRLSTFLDFLEMNFNIYGEVTPGRKLLITTNQE